MKQNNGLTLIALVITIIVLLILAGVSIALTLGENGIISRATTVESTYNQSEVLEELKTLTAEKYLAVYNETLGKDIETKYNTDILLRDFFDTEKDIIDYDAAKDDNGYRYYIIKIDGLKRNITKYGRGTWEEGDVFAIRRTVTTSGEQVTLGADCEVCYKPKVSESSEIVNIGALDINHPVK